MKIFENKVLGTFSIKSDDEMVIYLDGFDTLEEAKETLNEIKQAEENADLDNLILLGE